MTSVSRWIRAAGAALLACALWAPQAGAEDLVLHGMSYVSSKAGQPGLLLLAERARIEMQGDVAHLEAVSFEGAETDDGGGFRMTCERARLNLKTSDLYAEGNVRGRTGDGHHFSTTSASFDQGERLISTDEPVSIIDPSGTRFRGAGFRYDVRSERMRMLRATVEGTE